MVRNQQAVEHVSGNRPLSFLAGEPIPGPGSSA
jgi:hypothetical protein